MKSPLFLRGINTIRYCIKSIFVKSDTIERKFDSAMSRKSCSAVCGSSSLQRNSFFIYLGVVFLYLLGAFTETVSSESFDERWKSFAQLFGQSALMDRDESYHPYQNLYSREPMDTNIVKNIADLITGGTKFLIDLATFKFQEPRDTTPKRHKDVAYDFIVIGGGTAGATIAARLSEIAEVTVLLIEAGGDENLIMDVPVLVSLLQFNLGINWAYKTEPSDSYCLGMRNHQCKWPRGRVLGGSSVLNYLIATRGNKKDYDRWAQLGNYGWSWNEVLPYFKRLETMAISEFSNDTRYHNTNGPVNIDYVPFQSPLAKAFIQAGFEMGWDNVDYNGEKQTGFSYIQATMKDGTRFSSNKAYLHPTRKRANLHVTKKSLVTRILMDELDKRAIGVEFIKMNQTYRVFARKEVILSAGTIGSPQILMLSGIGPAGHLEEMGINVMIDAPVGENLMDHVSYGGLVFLTDQPVGLQSTEMLNLANTYMGDFLVHRKGPFTMPGGSEGVAFVNVDNYYDPNDYPNIELFFNSATVATEPTFRKNLDLDEEFWRKSFADVHVKHSWTIFPMLMRPKSRGRVLLRASDIHSKPRIIPNYFSDPDDVRVLVKGIRLSIEVAKTRAMREFNSELHQTPLSGCEGFHNDSDEYWECALRSFPMTIYHFTGTCKMAPEGDPTAVVNPRLQVSRSKN